MFRWIFPDSDTPPTKEAQSDERAPLETNVILSTTPKETRRAILLAPSGLWGAFDVTPEDVRFAKSHDYAVSPDDEEYAVGLADLPPMLNRPNIIAVDLMMRESGRKIAIVEPAP